MLFSRAEVGRVREELAQYRRDRAVLGANGSTGSTRPRERELAADRASLPRPTAAPVPGGRGVRRTEAGGHPMSPCTRSSWSRAGQRAAAPGLARADRGHRPVPRCRCCAAPGRRLDAIDAKQRDAARASSTQLGRTMPPPDSRRGSTTSCATCSAGATICAATVLTSSRSRSAEHDSQVVPSFVLPNPGEEPKPDNARLLGHGRASPDSTRLPGSLGPTWAATPVDRLALLCRHHGVELGLVTDGRWWALVWAPRGGVTRTAVFDAVAWPEAAERDVVRAFYSLLRRRRFFGVPDDETLVAAAAYQRGQPGGDHRAARRPGPPGGRAAGRRDRPSRRAAHADATSLA